MTMVTVMGIEKHAAFYRGYQPDDRSLLPVAIILATLVALSLLFYLISVVGQDPDRATAHSARPAHPTYVLSPAGGP